MRLTRSIAVEGDDVVIKLEGNRGRKPWIDVTRIYVMRASVRFEKNGWWLVKDESSHVYHWDEDAYPQTFIDALESAKSAVVAAKHAPAGPQHCTPMREEVIAKQGLRQPGVGPTTDRQALRGSEGSGGANLNLKTATARAIEA